MNADLPPLPDISRRGPQVCATFRLYLAVLHDLPPDQVLLVQTHVQTCADCAREHHLLEHVTQLVISLPASTPSNRVDQTVMAAIAAKGNGHTPIHPTIQPPARKRRLWLTGQLAAAAVLLLALVMVIHFTNLLPSSQPAFALPNTLSWNGYVLYLSETRIAANGERYHVTTYHILGTSHMHVETTMPGSLDVVAIGDEHDMLGMDMTHHIAQRGAHTWSVDDSIFNAEELRNELKTHQAMFLGKDRFQSQDVYRIRCANGLVILLNMYYQPVNVLSGIDTGEPMYETLALLPASQVPESMWDMTIPPGFQMGKLPERP
jgi:hypothetical protein